MVILELKFVYNPKLSKIISGDVIFSDIYKIPAIAIYQGEVGVGGANVFYQGNLDRTFPFSKSYIDLDIDGFSLIMAGLCKIALEKNHSELIIYSENDNWHGLVREYQRIEDLPGYIEHFARHPSLILFR